MSISSSDSFMSSASSQLEKSKATARSSIIATKTPEYLYMRISRLAVAICVSACCYYVHGFSNSASNGMLTLPSFHDDFPEINIMVGDQKQRDKTSRIQGVTVGSYQLGAATGALLSLMFLSRFGRRPVIIALTALLVIGTVLQTSAFSLAHLIVGRIILGMGTGAAHVAMPLYLSETSPPKTRGRSVIIGASSCNLGHLLGSVVELAVYYGKGSMQWRLPLGLMLVAAVPAFLMSFFIPESPRLLIKKDKYEDAVYAASILSGHDEREEIDKLEDSMNEHQTYSQPIKRILMVCFIQIMSSGSGIDVVTFFSTETFQQQLKFSSIISRALTIGLQAVQWGFSTASIFLVDTLGRKPLLMISASVMTCCTGALVGLTKTGASEPMLKSAILFFYLVMCAYPIGYHLVPSLYAAEISPAPMRHRVMSVAMALHFLTDFIVTMVTPIAFQAINSYYYLVYVGTNGLTFFVLLFLFPETKGLELEDIENLFKKNE